MHFGLRRPVYVDELVTSRSPVLDLISLKVLFVNRSHEPWTSNVRSQRAGSTGRRNTGVKSLCWCFKLQGLTWSFV